MQTTLAQLAGNRVFTFDEVLSPYVYVFYAAFLISWIFTPIMRCVAVYFGIVDQPDTERKIHTTPVAYLGGVAVFLGWISGLACSQFLLLHRAAVNLHHVHVYLGIVAGACIILALGLWDDLLKIKPWMKIIGQVSAAVTLIASGIGSNIANQFFQPVVERSSQYFGLTMEPGMVAVAGQLTSWAIVVAIVVFCCNATNLMDGLDGLCGGVTGIISFGFMLLAVHLGMNSSAAQTNNDGLRVVLALALLGGVMGFVPYNFNPASIFMGDTGSMFLGFSCALLILMMGEVGAKWFLAAMVMFALPVLDTALAFARRWVNKRPFFSADKQHFHHQLVSRGMSVRKAVIFMYVLAILFVLCGIAIVFMRTRYAIAFYMVIFCSIIVAARKMGMIHEKPTMSARKPLPDGGITSSTFKGGILDERE